MVVDGTCGAYIRRCRCGITATHAVPGAAFMAPVSVLPPANAAPAGNRGRTSTRKRGRGGLPPLVKSPMTAAFEEVVPL